MKVKNLLDNTTEIPQNEPQMKLPIEVFMPWANIIVKFKIPDEIFEELQKMYEYTMKDWKSFGLQLVGQVEEEPEVTMEIQHKFPKWSSFCLECVNNFVITQRQINFAAEPEKFKIQEFRNELLSKINTMWFVRQKPGEYNPMHIHTNCKVSAIAYLKTPKQQVRSRKDHYQSDGKITFTNNTGSDMNFANYQASFEPKPGDMYVFPALQHHMVWPYRSADPNDERVSISFNSDIVLKSELDRQQQQQEEMYKQMKKMKESENDKSADVSNINKSG